jgi:hypothetical protein
MNAIIALRILLTITRQPRCNRLTIALTIGTSNGPCIANEASETPPWYSPSTIVVKDELKHVIIGCTSLQKFPWSKARKPEKERKQRSHECCQSRSESRLTGGFYGNPGLESRSVVDTKEKPSHGCIEMGPKNMATQRDSLASRLIAGRPNFLLIQNAQGILYVLLRTIYTALQLCCRMN